MNHDDYRAPRWLPGSHLQTIIPALLSHAPAVQYRRERWDTPDQDFIDIDWVDADYNAPLVVLLHGLEGSSQSHYARALMAKVKSLGWRGCVPHFRGCSGEPNRAPRAYHAGDTAEVEWIVEQLRHHHPAAPIMLCGVSLGGNQVLKWLGEQGVLARQKITAAAGISAPLDLLAAGVVLDRGINRHVYTREFLKTLIPKALHTLQRYPQLADAKVVSKARSFKEFDRFFTAPVHGYIDHTDYWRRASSKPGLRDIAVPTLIINARNDPFLPESALPLPNEVADCVELCFPRHGGHVGFAQGAFPGHLDWLPQTLCRFFQRHL